MSGSKLVTLLPSSSIPFGPVNAELFQNSKAIVTRTVSSDIDIATGRFDGFDNFEKFGENTDIDSGSVPEDIWEGGGVYTGFPVDGVAETVDIVSSSANDASGGSGAEQVTIFGLDGNWRIQTENIILNGTTAVTSTKLWRRVNRMVVIQSNNGANDAFNAGTITVSHTITTANVFVSLQPGLNQTRILAYTVPKDKILLLEQVQVAVDRNNSAVISGAIWLRLFGKPPVLIRSFSATQNETFIDTRPNARALGSLPEKTDFTIRITSSSANNVNVAGIFDGTLVENPDITRITWANTSSIDLTRSTADHYSLANSGLNYQVTQTSLTIMGWVKMDSFGGGGDREIMTNYDNTNFGYRLFVNSNGAMQYSVVTSSGNFYNSFTPNGTIVAGTWHHVVGTFNKDTGRSSVWVDGTEYLTNSSGGTIGTITYSGQTPLIGNITGLGKNWDGHMSQLSIFTRLLDSDEVAEAYNSGSPVNPDELSYRDDLQHAWLMGDGDADTVTTIVDQIGSANMTAVNSPTLSSDVP